MNPNDQQHRMALEQIALAAIEGIEQAIGKNVDIGVHGRFNDDEVTSRLLPLRASLVNFQGRLQDCVIGISSMAEQYLEPAMAAAGVAISKAFGEGSTCSPPELHTYEEREEALEQLDALWSEPTVHITTPKGDLLLVVGHGMVASIERINGHQNFGEAEEEEGSFTDEATLAAAAAAKLAGPDIHEGFTFQPAGSGAVAGDTAGVAAGGGGDLGADDIAAMLSAAADMGAVAPEVAARAQHAELTDFSTTSAHAQTAAANAMASSGADQWAELLSGVEVDITAELGRTSMRLGQVASLVDESVLTLDQLVDDPVMVYVNGSLYASARLVVVDNEYGIEIVEVFDPAAASPVPGMPLAAASAA